MAAMKLHSFLLFLVSVIEFKIPHGDERLEKLREIAEEVLLTGGLENFGKDRDPRYRPNMEGAEEDCFLNVSQLITSKGYGCEEHTAETSDGYLLSLQRMSSSQNRTQNSSVVVLLQHGFLDSSATWVINQASNSLGFLLADEGYDVWLSNSRGNVYSDKNVEIKTRKRKFWDFSWDEMAELDLPATVDYIISQTNATQIYYVGHSQGTLIGFTGFSINQTLASKIKRFFALAPISNVGNLKGPIRLFVPFHGPAYTFLNLIGYEDVLPSSNIEEFFGRTVCSISPLFCEAVTFAVAGIDVLGYNKSRSDVYYSHFPAGTSLRDVNHWAQSIQSGDTQYYDFGYFENKQKYGTHKAPIYNISTLSVPVALFSGTHDWMADPKDVDILRGKINSTIVYDKTISRFDHLDFVWGMTAHLEVYREIISQIKKAELGE